MNIRLLLVFTLSILALSCGESPDVYTETQAQELTPATLPAGEGTYNLSYGAGLFPRQYWVYVPPSWPNGGPYTAIFNFHGAGLNFNDYHNTAANQDLKARARAGNVVLVFPLGAASWNAGHCCLMNPFDDLGFISDLVPDLETEFSLNHDKVYAMGHSNGGMMVQRIAAEEPDLFAAYASVNGSAGSWTASTASVAPGCDPQDAACTGWDALNVLAPTAPVDIMMVQSKDDTVVPYDGGLNSVGGGKIWHLPAAPSPAYSTSTWEVWEAANGCAGPVVTTFVAGERWRCSGSADLKMAHIDVGTGHEWPQNLLAGALGYDANTHIIDFFLAHPR